MDAQMIKYIQTVIMQDAKGLRYTVSDKAPSTEVELFNATSLVIWSGASRSTIYQSERVNWAFRALHDSLHLSTGLDFSVGAEVELGRIQASKYSSDLMRELVYAEVAGQALYYGQTGQFVSNQVEFTVKHLTKMGVLK